MNMWTPRYTVYLFDRGGTSMSTIYSHFFFHYIFVRTSECVCPLVLAHISSSLWLSFDSLVLARCAFPCACHLLYIEHRRCRCSVWYGVWVHNFFFIFNTILFLYRYIVYTVNVSILLCMFVWNTYTCKV